MKRKRFTEEQIITVLGEQEAGAKAADVCRRHGVSEATLYNWKAKYGGMDVSDAKRLKALEDEKVKLNRSARSSIEKASALPYETVQLFIRIPYRVSSQWKLTPNCHYSLEHSRA